MRCFIYFYFIFVQFYVGFCHFLELTDLSLGDSLPYVWPNRVTTQLQQTKCTVQTPNSRPTDGICISRSQCLMTGGIVIGTCGLLSTCCTYGRVRSTNDKVSYFSSNDVSFTNSPITFNVMRFNENVCQLRLDFLEFDLAPAITNTGGVECEKDRFYVTPGVSMPAICGYNTGQHIYVHISPETRTISLHVKFADRTGNGPKWNIKVTQLQCPLVPDRKFGIDKSVADDYSLLAPQGCLQYFTKDSGSIKSFGYKDSRANRILVANQHYSICFRKTPYICGIQFTVRDITLDTSPQCINYFIMPDTTLTTLLYPPKICEGDLGLNDIINVRYPGPLHIDFNVDDNNNIAEGGFHFDYDLERC